MKAEVSARGGRQRQNRGQERPGGIIRALLLPGLTLHFMCNRQFRYHSIAGKVNQIATRMQRKRLKSLIFLTLIFSMSVNVLFILSQDKKDKKDEKKKPSEPFAVKQMTHGMGLYSLGSLSPD